MTMRSSWWQVRGRGILSCIIWRCTYVTVWVRSPRCPTVRQWQGGTCDARHDLDCAVNGHGIAMHRISRAEGKRSVMAGKPSGVERLTDRPHWWRDYSGRASTRKSDRSWDIGQVIGQGRLVSSMAAVPGLRVAGCGLLQPRGE